MEHFTLKEFYFLFLLLTLLHKQILRLLPPLTCISWLKKVHTVQNKQFAHIQNQIHADQTNNKCRLDYFSDWVGIHVPQKSGRPSVQAFLAVSGMVKFEKCASLCWSDLLVSVPPHSSSALIHVMWWGGGCPVLSLTHPTAHIPFVHTLSRSSDANLD